MATLLKWTLMQNTWWQTTLGITFWNCIKKILQTAVCIILDLTGIFIVDYPLCWMLPLLDHVLCNCTKADLVLNGVNPSWFMVCVILQGTYSQKSFVLFFENTLLFWGSFYSLKIFRKSLLFIKNFMYMANFSNVSIKAIETLIDWGRKKLIIMCFEKRSLIKHELPFYCNRELVKKSFRYGKIRDFYLFHKNFSCHLVLQ